MKHTLCVNCIHGTVTQETQELGKQDPVVRAYCSKTMNEVGGELAFCSQLQSPRTRLNPWDAVAEPVIIRSKDQINKAIAEGLAVGLNVITEIAKGDWFSRRSPRRRR